MYVECVVEILNTKRKVKNQKKNKKAEDNKRNKIIIRKVQKNV